METTVTARRVIDTEIEGLRQLSHVVGPDLDRALDLLTTDLGKIIVTGVGKSGIVARKIAATLSSTGSPSLFLDAGDADHGDLGIIGLFDVLLVLSKSGGSRELDGAIRYSRERNVPVIAMTEDAYSHLGVQADIVLKVPPALEACPLGAPTTSTTMMMTYGDVLAVILMEKKKFSQSDFAQLHPGGVLGGILGSER